MAHTTTRQNTTTQKRDRSKWTSVTITHELLRELRIAKAHRNEEINVLLVRAWEAFKAAEGKRLLQPIDDQDAA